MDILYACCAGLDVHKETVVATVRRQGSGKVQRRTRAYGTMTEQLLSCTIRCAASLRSSS
jgi:hypothetical protein